MRLLLGIVVALLVVAAPARAEERLLTLYSPPIDSEPYVHRSTTVTLKPDGVQAPAEPGYVLGFKEQVLVDSKDPDAKPLPVSKMMVHHLLYYTPGRVDQGSGCLGGAFIGGRGEEHPNGQFAALHPPEIRARYGVRNATDSGVAPEWSVTAMVMNHYQRSKRFYVRTKLWYTTEARTQAYPTTIGDCRHLGNGMAYDVPGGGKPGETYVDRSTWTVPFNGRILAAGSHHHGGATHQTLASTTCNRTLLDARAYYGAANHPYNTIRPILHEPGPIANGTFSTAQGIPIAAGEVLERTAMHDNSSLHVAAMGFWVLNLVRDDAVTACAPMPTDLREVTKPARFDRAAPYVYDREVPQLFEPDGRWTAFSGAAVPIGDQFFKPALLSARVGEKVTWRFAGYEPHSVTVANGPRGFSSNYLGHTSGSYSFTPTVPGTYRLTCLIHPTTMAQTLKVTKGT
jgi:plastocyanin